VIKVTRLNGEVMAVNAEMIQYVESKPDTIITLATKERILVKESMDEVIGRIIEYGRALRTFPPERI
jgi:flagellar protein FlbD